MGKGKHQGSIFATRWVRTVRESEVIDKIDRAFRLGRDVSRALRLGIGDDAAVFRPRASHEVLLTCDWLLEGTHFLREKHPPDSVGWKCLARALSDIAAMGGVPRCFLLSVALPETHTGRWLDGFLAGLARASRKFGCVLAGGDTTRRREISVNAMVVGEARTGRAVARSGANPGELIYVSGRLGEAELGLEVLRRRPGRGNPKRALTRKHLYPEPRLALGRWVAEKRLASSMVDLSDGLSSDLLRLCAASGVGACLESATIPCLRHPDTARKYGLDPLRLALHGGDDYELLFTVPLRKTKLLPRTFQGIPLTPIGKITKESKVVLRDERGREELLAAQGWDPFRRSGP